MTTGTSSERRPVDWGWRVAAGLLAAGALIQIGVLFYDIADAEGNKPVPGYTYSRRPRQGVEEHVPRIVATTVGIGLAVVGAVGLWKGAEWAKWLVLAMVGLGAVALFAVIYMADRRQPGDAARVGMFAAAGVQPVAWFLVLDRPSTVAKVSTGATLVVFCWVALRVLGS